MTRLWDDPQVSLPCPNCYRRGCPACRMTGTDEGYQQVQMWPVRQMLVAHGVFDKRDLDLDGTVIPW